MIRSCIAFANPVECNSFIMQFVSISSVCMWYSTRAPIAQLTSSCRALKHFISNIEPVSSSGVLVLVFKVTTQSRRECAYLAFCATAVYSGGWATHSGAVLYCDRIDCGGLRPKSRPREGQARALCV